MESKYPTPPADSTPSPDGFGEEPPSLIPSPCLSPSISEEDGARCATRQLDEDAVDVAAVLASASDQMQVSLGEWTQPWLPSWFDNHSGVPVRLPHHTQPPPLNSLPGALPSLGDLDGLVNDALARMHSDAFMVHYLREGSTAFPFDSSFNGYPHLLMVYLAVRRSRVPGADVAGFTRPVHDSRPWLDQLVDGSLVGSLRASATILMRRWLALYHPLDGPTSADLLRLATQVELPVSLVAAWLVHTHRSTRARPATLFEEMLQLFPQEPASATEPAARVLEARRAFASLSRHSDSRSEAEAQALAAVANPDRGGECGTSSSLWMSRTCPRVEVEQTSSSD